jgi:pyridoxamine 5'-phosphate oxidase family protein
MTVTLTEAERAYLQSQPLARLATVDGAGAPQNNPVGAFLDEETGDIIIGGHAMGASRKFRNVQRNGHVALVIDDLVSPDPWTVRGLEIRGTAVALEDVDPPVPFMSREVIRITPTWVTSWGVDPGAPGRYSRRA